MTVPPHKIMVPGEDSPIVFISSAMTPEMAPLRDQAVSTTKEIANLRPWAFEFTPASSEPVVDGYLRHVRRAAIVVWLATKDTTPAVRAEIEAAMDTNRRLLVFRFFEGEGSPVTSELLSRLSRHVKWTSMSGAVPFPEALRLALCDEITRALQNDATPPLGDILDEMWRHSIARCVERWQSVQVPHDLASEMALDLSIGMPPLEAARGVRVITGDVGIGKSLAIERLYQRALQCFRDDRSTPIPIFIRNPRTEGGFEREIQERASPLGNPRVQGVLAFIDGGDEDGEGCLSTLIQESRILSKAWPHTSFTLASRPLPLIAEIKERVELPKLTDEQAASLISRMADHEFHPLILRSFSPPIREAIFRPLFSIIYGLCIRQQMSQIPRSEGELLDALADRAIRRTSDCVRTSNALRHLAVLSVERGARHVHSAEVSDQGDLHEVCETGIVVRRDMIIEFPLIVLRDWFASEAIIRSEVTADMIADSTQHAERWRYPLIIALAKMDHGGASRVLEPLVAKQPAFAAQVVRKALINTISIEEYSLPPAVECGRQLRSALSSWLDAIGPLACVYAPLDDHGRLPPLAVDRQDHSLALSWYDGTESIPDVVEMTFSEIPVTKRRDWPYCSWSVIGRQPAWAWLRSLEMITHYVSGVVQKHRLSPPEGPVREEMLWSWVLEITRRGGAWSEPISLEEITQATESLHHGRIHLSPFSKIIDLSTIRTQLELLKAAKTDVWPAPSPGRDLPAGTWIWSSYSDPQLLAKVKVIYENALTGYQQMVEAWFPAFRERLEHAVTLPARLTGIVIPATGDSSLKPPRINWFLDPLPDGADNEVSLKLGREPLPTSSVSDQFNKLRKCRPQAAGWISAWHEDSAIDLSSATPATDLAYRWIERDLKSIAWMH